MAPIVSSIDIARPPDVFAYVCDPSRFAEWQRVTSCACASGNDPPGVGAGFTTTRRISGVERTMTQEVTGSARSWAVRGVDGPIRPGATVTVERSTAGRGRGSRSRSTSRATGSAGRCCRPCAGRRPGRPSSASPEPEGTARAGRRHGAMTRPRSGGAGGGPGRTRGPRRRPGAAGEGLERRSGQVDVEGHSSWVAARTHGRVLHGQQVVELGRVADQPTQDAVAPPRTARRGSGCAAPPPPSGSPRCGRCSRRAPAPGARTARRWRGRTPPGVNDVHVAVVVDVLGQDRALTHHEPVQLHAESAGRVWDPGPWRTRAPAVLLPDHHRAGLGAGARSRSGSRSRAGPCTCCRVGATGRTGWNLSRDPAVTVRLGRRDAAVLPGRARVVEARLGRGRAGPPAGRRQVPADLRRRPVRAGAARPPVAVDLAQPYLTGRWRAGDARLPAMAGTDDWTVERANAALPWVGAA